MRDILLIIHILAAAVWIGGATGQAAFGSAVVASSNAAAATWMRRLVRMGQVYYTPAAIVVLASGVGLVLNSSLYEFEHTFVVIGVLMVLIAGGLGGRLYAPKAREAADAYEGGDTTAGNAAAATITRAAYVEMGLLVVTVAAMVYRWGV